VSESKQKIMIREEQILVTSRVPVEQGGGYRLGGRVWTRFPWKLMEGCQIYALDEDDLDSLLREAVEAGYMVISGFHSERRGLRGFTIGLGAWGWMGRVECRTVDAWGFSRGDMGVEDDIERIQAGIRQICRRLNAEPTPFRATAARWISGLYDRLGAPHEPEGYPEPLPGEVATMARRAHVGGPIIHCRTTLRPFVSIDRERAYGQAMLGDLPVGQPVDVPCPDDGLARWTERDLMSACGIAEATVYVPSGPFVSLLPLIRPETRFDRNRTMYPTGRFRGVWCLHELAALERTGRGRVEALHRVVTFQRRPVLAGVVRYLRKLEPDFPVRMKHFEHMLYGKCARGLSLNRMSSAPANRVVLPRDLLDDRALRRIEGRIELRQHSFERGRDRRRGAAVPVTQKGHPLYKVIARLSPQAEHGSMDRPDRSAWITAENRIQVAILIDLLDVALGATRSGSYVGRIYVDGLDVEATPDALPTLPGALVKRHGSRMRLYRAGAIAYDDASTEGVIEASGLSIDDVSSEEDLVKTLRRVPDPEGGPFAGGRVWKHVPGEMDPRMLPDVGSEPFHIDVSAASALGLSP
jgi:hypothetical protein